jgi:hypothetical protein
MLKQEPNLKVNLRLDCKTMKDELAYNVIAELRGTAFPKEVIVIGGHLDSWDIGEGAHDDGAGCVQSMEVLHLFKIMGIKPQRTIRCVLFANEENGLRGGKAYAQWVLTSGEVPVAAIESDGGGHMPRGFSFDGVEPVAKANANRLRDWRNLLMPYGSYEMEPGGSGADIGPLRDQGTLLFGLRPESQRYFDYHHSVNDVFETVHKRELEFGAASMTALVWLLDRYGVVSPPVEKNKPSKNERKKRQ